MMEELRRLTELLSGKSIVLLHSPDVAKKCIEVFTDPLGAEDYTWKKCFASLEEKKRKEEELLRFFASKFKVRWIVHISPSLASIEEKSIEEINLYWDPSFYSSFGAEMRMISENREVLFRSPKYWNPVVEFMRTELPKKLSRALRASMSSDLLLVLGNPEQLFPAAMIPWVAKKYGKIELVIVSDKEVSLAKLADAFIKINPHDLLKSPY